MALSPSIDPPTEQARFADPTSLLCDGRIRGAAVGLTHAEFGIRRAESSTWRLEAGERRARYAGIVLFVPHEGFAIRSRRPSKSTIREPWPEPRRKFITKCVTRLERCCNPMRRAISATWRRDGLSRRIGGLSAVKVYLDH
jgi:hypothetical protein